MDDKTKALDQIDSIKFDYELDNMKVKNIEYIYRAHAHSISAKYSDEKSCNDIIFWIHNKVNNMKDKINQSEINDIFSELKKIWDNINGKLKTSGNEPLSMCDISNINALNFGVLKQKKIMSDYCQNFDNLRTKLTTNPHKRYCDIYYEYFKNTMKAYNDVFEKCYKPGANTDNCPKICIQKQNNPQIILNNLRCNKIPKPVIEEKLITEKQCDKEKGVLQSELEQALLDSSNPVLIYSDPRVIFLILFTFWGIFLTLFFFYK
ncbi:PIR Superfamily Protein, partial [Plasmodium ovale curtisi]